MIGLSKNERSLLAALARTSHAPGVATALRDCLREWDAVEQSELARVVKAFRQNSREVSANSPALLSGDSRCPSDPLTPRDHGEQ